jgi:hypothetical protein
MSAVSRFVIKHPDYVFDAPSDVICTQILSFIVRSGNSKFYNYKRRHSSIAYMTPHQKYNELNKVA